MKMQRSLEAENKKRAVFEARQLAELKKLEASAKKKEDLAKKKAKEAEARRLLAEERNEKKGRRES